MTLFFSIWLAIIGAVLGSFLACMGYRIPNKIKTTYPSSFCSNCNKSLKWYMNVPIISYILLGGKCAYCKKKIGFIYFLCEVLCSILFVVSYLIHGFDANFFLAIIITCALIVTIVSDFKYYYISDRVIVISSLLVVLIEFIFMKEEILMRLVSALIIFVIMIGIKILGNAMFKRESLGDGDIKLMVIVGLTHGLLNSFVSLFFGSVLAIIYVLFTIKKNKDGLVPFGPFILGGTLLLILTSNIVVPYLTKLLTF